MTTSRQPSSRQGSSSKRSSGSGRTASGSRDLFADLHALRRRLAAQFDYDNLRLIEYMESQPLPPGLRTVNVPATPKKSSRKSA